MKNSLIIIASILTLTACASQRATEPATASVILEHRADYASARNGNNLVIRPPLSDYLISHQFDIPG